MIYSNKVIATSLLLLNGLASAHLCMWAPPQRAGAFQIEVPGEHVCYLKEGPCGGVESSLPKAKLGGGEQYTVRFQQNLNHFYIENPGSLVIDFAEKANPAEEDFYPIGEPIPDYNALNEITQTNFTIPASIPNIDCPHCVLRMRYLSQNPTENDRGMTFYQCADVQVTKQDESVLTKKVMSVVNEVKQAEGSSCCAAPQFTISGFETGSWRNPTQKQYYFDSVQQLFRVDSNSGSGVTSADGHFKMFNNFTSGIEYYYNVNTDECDLYGLNYWSDWCYGDQNKQEYKKSIVVGSEVSDVWSQQGTPFLWTNQREGCIPLSMNREDTGEMTSFYDYHAGAPDSSVFELPAACVAAERKMKDVKDLPKSKSLQF